MDEEYLKLFSQINGDSNPEKNEDDTKFSDRVDYSQFENLSKPRNNQFERLNETPDVSKFQINENLNDGWDRNFQFQFETRINGELMSSTPPPAPTFTRKRQSFDDPNGLNKYLIEENLNEVYKNPMQDMHVIKEVMSHDLTGPHLTESFDEVGIVSVELFNRINSKAFLSLAGSVDIKKL